MHERVRTSPEIRCKERKKLPLTVSRVNGSGVVWPKWAIPHWTHSCGRIAPFLRRAAGRITTMALPSVLRIPS